jgi:hypothetical protein
MWGCVALHLSVRLQVGPNLVVNRDNSLLGISAMMGGLAAAFSQIHFVSLQSIDCDTQSLYGQCCVDAQLRRECLHEVETKIICELL